MTKTDGDIAKMVRNTFIKQHCRAVWVPLPNHADIAQLEAAVIALAPAHMTAWNRRGMEAYDEPTDLVDETIDQLGLRPVERTALLRQRDRFHGRSEATITDSVLSALPQGAFQFFALDMETANQNRGSICQLGLACVRPDGAIETWVTLVDPRTSHWVFSDLHGVTAEMVAGAPTIAEVLDALEPVLTERTIYQHSGFDRSAIRAACAALGRLEPAWDWKDSVSVAQAAWPELKGAGGHGLASLKRHLGLVFEHHDAGEDARAAAEIVLLAEKGRRLVEPSKGSAAVEITARSAPPAPSASGSAIIGRSILTQGNLNHSHFYLRGYLNAFPNSAVGAAKCAAGEGHMLTIDWGDGITSKTDICKRHKIFRDRANTRAFFERNNARPGDVVEVVACAQKRYRVGLARG